MEEEILRFDEQLELPLPIRVMTSTHNSGHGRSYQSADNDRDSINVIEISKTALGLIVGLITALTFVFNLIVSWKTSELRLEGKLDESRFVRDSIYRSALSNSVNRDLDLINTRVQAGFIEQSARLREICVAIRQGCR